MKTITSSVLVLGAIVCLPASTAAQAPVGALAIDERQGDQYGWAVDYETAGTAGQRALSECGPGCSVVLTFERCAAYAADQDAGSTVYGWAESYDSAAAARQRALAECGSQGSGCTVRVWGCNGPVVEEGLGLDRAARRQVQEGLQAAGFDPGGADGIFGPRTRAAIRSWQMSWGARATGYLDDAAAAAFRPPASPVASPSPTSAQARGALAIDVQGGRRSLSLEGEAHALNMCGTAGCEVVATFSSCMGVAYSSSTQGPTVWAWMEAATAVDARVGALDECTSAGGPACEVLNVLCLDASAASAEGPSEVAASGSRVSGTGVSDADRSVVESAAADLPLRPGDVFRDCDECPEMVVLPGGDLAMGRYEVTVGEYRAFASATGGGAGLGCFGGDSWRDPGFLQTDRHPVTCVAQDDAQEYVSWLSRRTGATYQLPSEAEWERAATGSPDGVGCGDRSDAEGTCPVGTYGANAAGLSDMVGNLFEWTSDCWEGDCVRRVLRGGAWLSSALNLRPSARIGDTTARRNYQGFRVSRTLD